MDVLNLAGYTYESQLESGLVYQEYDAFEETQSRHCEIVVR